MSVKRIVVVGSINADLVTLSARMPHPGETLEAASFHVFPGGKGANQAVGIARLGHPVQLLGCVGRDVFAPMLLDSLVSAGVGIEDLEQVDGNSGIASITTLSSGENRILIVPGANQAVTPAYVDRHREALLGAAMILTQLETPLETLEYLAAFANRHGMSLMLDPAPAVSLNQSLLQHVAWLTPNLGEASLLLAEVDAPSPPATGAAALLERLLQSGPRGVLIKLGEDGVIAGTRDGSRFQLAAHRVQVVDTTAAGDAFNAGFATALARGGAPEHALQFANAVAALAVTRRGAQPSLPTGAEVERFCGK